MIGLATLDALIRRWKRRARMANGYGIDVSRHQGAIDWPKVDAAWAYVKATEGVGFVDRMFGRQISIDPSLPEHLRASGPLLGAYHFARIDTGRNAQDDARNECEFFWATIEPARLPLRPALDVELGGIKRRDASYCREWWEAAIERMIELTGQPPVIYTGRWTIQWAFRGAPLPPWLTRCPLWWAEYCAPHGPRHVPPGWRLAAWQHTARGRCPGVRGDVDLNLPGPAVGSLLAR